MARRSAQDLGPVQLRDRLGLATWQFEVARLQQLIPDPDVAGGRWSIALAAQLAARLGEIVATVGTEHPIGAQRAAARLAERTGLDVHRADVEELAERGHLAVVDEYKGWPLYAPRQLDEVDLEELAPLVAERQAWLQASLDRHRAAEHLGWRLGELDRVVAERGLRRGRFGRLARADVEALAGDEELCERVEAERLIGPDQAAARLEVRRTDWDYAVLAGWIAPRDYASVEVGIYRRVTVPLYRTGDVDALLELPGVDWEAVRACRAGDPSPLREFATRPPTRAQVVRRAVAELGGRFGIEVWAFYRGSRDRWEIDWEQLDGRPTADQVREAMAADPALAPFRADLEVSTESGAAVRWARAMLQPGAAVVLDTETTDLPGAICEIAVVDAATEQVLLDTLVNPGQPISQEARWVHGLSDTDVAQAPSWPEVLPWLLEATRGRQVLAYNAEFDAGVIQADCARHRLDPAHLAGPGRWGCVMNRRSDWHRTRRWLPLWGGHRALGDALAALDVLRQLATPRGQPPALST